MTELYYLEVSSDDKISIRSERLVNNKCFCLQDPSTSEEKFLTFENQEDALKWMFDNVKDEYIDSFYRKMFSTKPYGQKKYFK